VATIPGHSTHPGGLGPRTTHDTSVLSCGVPEVSLTTWIALYGGIVSTLVALWTVYRGITNRGRLRLQVYTALHAVPGVGVIKQDRLAYKIVNDGRQPIWLKQIGGRYRDTEFLLVTQRQLPCKLEPGEEFLEAEASAADVLDKQKPLYLCAWDTTNKIHKLSGRTLKALLKERRTKQ
jgi:hypothetical protein